MPYPLSAGPAGQTANGAADQQAMNELRYKRYLEQLAGFSPGESDLSDDEIMRRQAMAAQARNQAQPPSRPAAGYAGAPGQRPLTAVPFQAILNQIHSRPGMYEHLEGVDLDGDGRADLMAPMGPPPMDPAGRMQWQTMMARRQQMAQQVQQNRTRRRALNNQYMLQALQGNDPLFAKVISWLDSFYEVLPPKVRRGFDMAMQNTPGAFLEMYAHMRDHLIGEIRGIQSGASPSTNVPMPRPGDADPRARIRQAVAGRMDPIVLESAGALDDRLPAASRNAELAALKKRVKSGGAKEGDLLRYIELSMDSGSNG